MPDSAGSKPAGDEREERSDDDKVDGLPLRGETRYSPWMSDAATSDDAAYPDRSGAGDALRKAVGAPIRHRPEGPYAALRDPLRDRHFPGNSHERCLFR